MSNYRLKKKEQYLFGEPNLNQSDDTLRPVFKNAVMTATGEQLQLANIQSLHDMANKPLPYQIQLKPNKMYWAYKVEKDGTKTYVGMFQRSETMPYQNPSALISYQGGLSDAPVQQAHGGDVWQYRYNQAQEKNEFLEQQIAELKQMNKDSIANFQQMHENAIIELRNTYDAQIEALNAIIVRERKEVEIVTKKYFKANEEAIAARNMYKVLHEQTKHKNLYEQQRLNDRISIKKELAREYEQQASSGSSWQSTIGDLMNVINGVKDIALHGQAQQGGQATTPRPQPIPPQPIPPAPTAQHTVADAPAPVKRPSFIVSPPPADIPGAIKVSPNIHQVETLPPLRTPPPMPARVTDIEHEETESISKTEFVNAEIAGAVQFTNGHSRNGFGGGLYD
ncbi:MAG: hypothetical protein JNL32_00200 [Candidatus Kapabacteria bacterium]|nr:hypothetical protein [Candidatus Kapabacteria bacterium]